MYTISQELFEKAEIIYKKYVGFQRDILPNEQKQYDKICEEMYNVIENIQKNKSVLISANYCL